eukprot:CAMPEP_0181447550 /NCGR_PEP_ID=MMETSP1110-20121109/26680_1 /TAXON_ID=174948 /ORGANISM="Symbiodinium sp., Strain CCMP421" /LENGTH=190 /DNA_ID=CAMNT_0023571667 /DNA_START=89 /DNA_END=661 /DNA_ORIENTATION=+
MPPVPRQQRRRKAAVVAAVLLLATITGLNLRAVAQEPSAADVDESLQKAEAVVAQGKNLEQEGTNLEGQEKSTISKQNPDEDEILEREEKVLEDRVRQTEYLLAEQEEVLDKRLSNLEVNKALANRVQKVQEEKESLRLERQRLLNEEQDLRRSEFRLEEEARRLRRDKAIRVFNIVPAFQFLFRASPGA